MRRQHGSLCVDRNDCTTAITTAVTAICIKDPGTLSLFYFLHLCVGVLSSLNLKTRFPPKNMMSFILFPLGRHVFSSQQSHYSQSICTCHPVNLMMLIKHFKSKYKNNAPAINQRVPWLLKRQLKAMWVAARDTELLLPSGVLGTYLLNLPGELCNLSKEAVCEHFYYCVPDCQIFLKAKQNTPYFCGCHHPG